MNKEKESYEHEQNVCVFWQNNSSVTASRFVGRYLVLWKARILQGYETEICG